MKFGIKFIDKFSKKHSEVIKLLGYIGVGVGFIGMISIFVFVLQQFYMLFTNPAAPAAFSLVIPGVHIPGSPIDIPLWVIIALFLVVVVHEAGHGLVSKAHGIPIKSTGVVFFGPIIGAFVEPDEKKLFKEKDIVQYSVFAAGPFANALFAIVTAVIMLFVLNPLTNAMVDPTGFSVASVDDGLPAQLAGVQPGITYSAINGINVTSPSDLTNALSCVRPNETVTLSSHNETLTVITAVHPDDPGRGYLGVRGISSEFEVKEGIPKWFFAIFRWLSELFFWIFTLNLGLGAANLLPLGPVDGGRMFQLALAKIFGEKKGNLIWSKTGLVLLLIIVFLVFIPIIRAIF